MQYYPVVVPLYKLTRWQVQRLIDVTPGLYYTPLREEEFFTQKAERRIMLMHHIPVYCYSQLSDESMRRKYTLDNANLGMSKGMNHGCLTPFPVIKQVSFIKYHDDSIKKVCTTCLDCW